MMILNKMKTIDEDKLNRLAEMWDGWDDSSDESEWKFTKDDLKMHIKPDTGKGFMIIEYL